MRYLLEIAYLGTNYNGWQNQTNALTIQGEIEDRLKILLKREIEIVGSSRTDTGVHATQQFAHLDLEEEIDNYYFKYKLNSLLPRDIVIKKIFLTASDFHARFEAVSRSYEYRIAKTKNPFLQNLALPDTRKYDLGKMNEAAESLLNHQDFESFSKVKTNVKNFLCTIKHAYWEEKEDLLIFHIKANRFLRGMVRAIVGTLLKVGSGEISIADFEAIISKKDRKKAGTAVAPEGLFLIEVAYPENKLIEIS